jgi:hypothetical protein
LPNRSPALSQSNSRAVTSTPSPKRPISRWRRLGRSEALSLRLASTAVLVPRQARIDRQHAQLLFNEVAYFFQSGWQFDLRPVFTPVNGFYRTRDDREIFFNSAYQHLRDGILRFLDCPRDHAAIACRVARFDAQALEDELSALGLCAAIKRSHEKWLSLGIVGRSRLRAGRAQPHQSPADLCRSGIADRVPHARRAGDRAGPVYGLRRTRWQLPRFLDARHRLGSRSDPAAPRAPPADLDLSSWAGQAERSADPIAPEAPAISISRKSWWTGCSRSRRGRQSPRPMTVRVRRRRDA